MAKSIERKGPYSAIAEYYPIETLSMSVGREVATKGRGAGV